MESSSSTSSSKKLLEAQLVARGWHIRDNYNNEDDVILSLIQSAPVPVEAIESELVNMDLRLFGAKSLPDTKKAASSLQGPLVLQVVSVRDIYHSSIDASLKSSQHQRRLLRFALTDGHSEVIAVEYAHIPSITEEIAPGTKIRLENKVPIHSGIFCLTPKNVTLLGGIVQSLYEEWQMSQKYSGLTRPSLRSSESDDGGGPPPFEKLEVEARPFKAAHHQAFPVQILLVVSRTEVKVVS